MKQSLYMKYNERVIETTEESDIQMPVHCEKRSFESSFDIKY